MNRWYKYIILFLCGIVICTAISLGIFYIIAELGHPNDFAFKDKLYQSIFIGIVVSLFNVLRKVLLHKKK